MNHGIQTRDASAGDAEALLALYDFLSSDNERCPLELAKKNISKIYKIDGSAVLLSEINGEALTTCTLIVVPNLSRGGRPYAVIENVVTHPDHRGKGLGKAILDAACERAWRNECYKVMLSTGSKRTAILSFYESAGFEQSRTGFQKRRLPKRQEKSS